MTPESAGRPVDSFDDDDYPAYTMGRAAEMLGTTPAFLRTLGEARLITPLRSEGGHRRYSRYQLRLAARVRELVDQGTPIDAACRIVILEDQLAEAQQLNQQIRDSQPSPAETPDAQTNSRRTSRDVARPSGSGGGRDVTGQPQ